MVNVHVLRIVNFSEGKMPCAQPASPLEGREVAVNASAISQLFPASSLRCVLRFPPPSAPCVCKAAGMCVSENEDSC